MCLIYILQYTYILKKKAYNNLKNPEMHSFQPQEGVGAHLSQSA